MIAVGKTDIGKRRKQNEDSVFISNTPIGNLPNLYIVADGMGGHKGGHIASKLAIEAFCDYIEEHKTVKICGEEDLFGFFRRSVGHANYMIYQKACQEPEIAGMGTTLTLCTLSDDYAYIAHVGDTRVYMFDGQALKQVTNDHSVVQELLEKGCISEEDMQEHPQRHMITRAVGTYEKVQVDTMKYPLEGVEKVLLCSDGLTNMLPEAVIIDILQGQDPVEKMLEQLIQSANDAGGQDNIATIIIKQGEVRS